ncbi:radical SAM protein [Candidatus Scalindua japonica]|uniref:radical SAM protein n=1 Tax=Candidatus Scalindua japonica TaxID=1284222 RepID=UPI0013A52D87|nr:radical SAM protein [Candidatus Scalindua japonica]
MQGLRIDRTATPPFLVLYITSTCNLSCGHCFYWTKLNKKDDLTFNEIKKFSEELAHIENLNITGGEPFIRDDFCEICRLFINNNAVKKIYVSTNGYFTDRTYHQVRKVLKEMTLDLLVIEISFDGMADYHNTLRGNKESFQKALDTYNMLSKLGKHDTRLQIHAESTVTSENIEEVRKLSHFLFDNCPLMEHHGIALIRDNWMNQALRKPVLEQYRELYAHLEKLWRKREKKRGGSQVGPLLQYAKCETIRKRRQVIPCLAGVLSGVVYANGDTSVCEIHEPLGNLRNRNFFEIWKSPESRKLLTAIRAKKCFCTHEMSMWSSIVFQPLQLIRTMIAAKLKKKWW